MAEEVGGSVEGFAVLMNNKAQELGLEDTHFVTPHGLDNDEHYTTAYELAKLANYALSNKKFREIVGTKNYTVTVNGTGIDISNGNELLGNFAGVYGVKTGFTSGANRCLVTACKRDDKDIITVVLGADTKNIRTKDSINILKYTFRNFEYINLEEKIKSSFKEWDDNNFVEINKGIEDYAKLKLGNIEYKKVLLNKNNVDNVMAELNCCKNLDAPVYANAKLGELNVSIGKENILTIDILNEYNIEKKSVYDYLYEIIENFKKYMLETSF